MTPTTLDTPTLIELRRARELLMAANKWVRLVEERAPPAWLRHDANPTPLRKSIDAFLSETSR